MFFNDDLLLFNFSFMLLESVRSREIITIA